MDYSWLDNEEFLCRIKEDWEKNRNDGVDPRIIWDLGWKKICELMKSEKRRRALVIPSWEVKEAGL